MSHSIAGILLHVVFSTKHREGTITPSIRERLHGYLAEVGRDMGCEVFRVGGVSDHVHLAVNLSRTVTVADFVKKIKTTSSSWIKEQGSEHTGFSWQIGYGAFAVSYAQRGALVAYIEGQEQHHQTISFQDEYRRILRKNGISVDETYLWD